jgi:hypothetical protein
VIPMAIKLILVYILEVSIKIYFAYKIEGIGFIFKKSKLILTCLILVNDTFFFI